MLLDNVRTTTTLYYYLLGVVFYFTSVLSKTMPVPSKITLSRTKLPGVWVDPDAKRMLGVGKSLPDLDVYCESFMFKKKVSKNRCKIEALRQQYGCFASKLVVFGSVMGHYLGTVWTPKNYYFFGNPDKEDFVIKTHDAQNRPFIIEPYDDKMLLQWINDGKRNCKQNLCNAVFVEDVIYGIPLVKVVAIRNIKKNEQIYVDYGDAYWKSREKNTKYRAGKK